MLHYPATPAVLPLLMFCVKESTYSVLKLSTGFTLAALTAWKLTVTNPNNSTDRPAIKNIHGEITIRFPKSCSQALAAHQATGEAAKIAITISTTKSLATSEAICKVDAPNTLRIPISLVRCLAEYTLKPNNPMQA